MKTLLLKHRFWVTRRRHWRIQELALRTEVGFYTSCVVSDVVREAGLLPCNYSSQKKLRDRLHWVPMTSVALLLLRSLVYYISAVAVRSYDWCHTTVYLYKYIVHCCNLFEEKLNLDVGAAAGGDSSASTLLSPVTPAEVKQKILYNLKGIVTV